MAGSAIPLSLLAKGIGQIVSNGHEKLEVYLEPEDYYNLKTSSKPYDQQVAPVYDHNDDRESTFGIPMPIHKTFVTRKGALLIFSEELANKAIAEQAQRLGLTNAHPKPRHEAVKEASHDDANDEVESLRTVHDLSWAILSYGSKPEYRKKGEDLFMRFIHESNKTHPERRIRPGFSPTRYISTWSKNWNDSLLQKLRSDGMISDKTLYRQNPVLPHLYQPTSYNLSSVPGPYRVTKTMLKNVPMMDSNRYKPGSEPTENFRSRRNEPEEHDYEFYKKQKDPPPSHQESEEKKNSQFGPIEAVKFLQTGQIEEVKYSELRPREKQEILAELLASAYEQQKHIQETLELVLASQKPRSTRSGASSSAASELMVDMHRAIMTLVESPVRKQIIEKQKMVQNEKEMKKREREKKKMEKEEIRQQRHAEKDKARLEKEMNVKKSHEEQVRLEKEKRRLEREKRRELRRLDKEEQKAAQLKAEQERLEQENLRKLERRERHRRRREEEDARKRQEDVPVASQRRRSERETENQFQNAERKPEERRRIHQVEAQDLNAAGGDILPNRQIATAERNHLKEAFLSANMKVPQAPANTPAQTNNYVKSRKHKPAQDVQYVERTPQALQEVGVSQKQQAASKKVQLYEEAPDDYDGKNYAQAPPPKKRESLRESGEEVSFGYQRKPSLTSRPSQESIHSTVQQKAFVIPNLQSNKSSSSNTSKSNYYAGALPISSNIVKQTLVDKVSLLSLNKSQQDEKSESYKSSVSEAKQNYRHDVVQEPAGEMRPAHPATHHVPHIGVEPATPMQKDLFASPVNVNLPVPKKTHLAPAASSKYSEEEESKKYSEESSSILSSKSSKSSKSKQEPNYATLKGAKGPGSQVSSSYLKSSDGKSSYSKGSRGNLPKKLQGIDSAAVFLPGNKVLSVGKSISKYSDTLPSITTEEEDALVPPAAELPEESTEKDLSKTTKSLSESSSIVTSKKTSQKSSAKGGGSERRVSFKDDVSEKSGAPSSYKKSSARESETEEETEWEETEESADEWPDVQSEKSSKIAQKVASMVVAENRPDSNLEEDALKAAELWNSIAQEEEDEETEYEESESATAEDSEAAFRVAAQEQEKKEMEVKAKLEEDRKKSLQEKNKREIIARKKIKSPSVKSAATSEKSSHTSAQESSISDAKSQLDVDVDIEAESESQITESSTKSKAKDAGKRIPLSRGSSQTDKSSKISSSTKSVKKKLVVDVPKQSAKARDSSPSPQRFKTPMSDASSVAASERRRSSIPVDGADVQLGYNVTTYESKLGDPKPEEPIKTRTNIEPKKIKKTTDSKSKPAKKEEVSTDETKQDTKKEKKSKENVQKTKKGKLAAEEASDGGESSDHSTMTAQKDQSVKAKPPKGKPVKSEAKKKPAKERVPLDKPKKIADKVTKTPETPFVAGRAKAEKVPADTEPIHPEELNHEPHPPADESKRDMVTPKPKSKPASLKSKPATPQPSPKPQLQKAESVVEMKSEVVQDEIPDDESELFVTPSPAKSPEDDYEFVRVEEEEEEEELPPLPEPEVEISKPEDDQKSVKSDATAKTTQSNKTAEDQKSSQEDEAEKEAKLAAKRERENKRAAAAERRRIEVEKKRKEKEDQARKERDEQEREEQMKEQFEEEKKRREEAVRKKKEEAEMEKQRELQEVENRRKREEAQRERERKQQEEKKKKMEEMQRRKREEEEKKRELARIKKEEDEQRRKEEEEMLAAMEDAEREEYQRIKREEEERLRIEAEERRVREEEEARIAMEQARLQAIIRAKQQAALEEKLKFVREFLTESNGLEQTQNVHRAFTFSYFQLMEMLGLDANDFPDEF